MKRRDWLYGVQSTLNDAHLIVTDRVNASGNPWSADELVLLDRIDTAIMFVQSMRQTDQRLDAPLIVRKT